MHKSASSKRKSDTDEDSFEDLSEETFEHDALPAATSASSSTKKIKSSVGAQKAAGAPLSDVTFVEVAPLKQRRRQVGVLPDDGSNRREDKEGDVDHLYGRTWLNEAVARQALLNANVHYRFARLVSGGANSTLELVLQESEISRITRERIADATRALVERRRQQQDTRGEQDRAKALRDEVNKLRSEALYLHNTWEDVIDHQQGVRDALAVTNTRRLTYQPPPDNVSLDPTEPAQYEGYARIFDRFTRSSVARFGPLQFERSLDLFRTVVQVIHGQLLGNAAIGDANFKQRVHAEMPRSSELALHWATLLAIYLKSDILARVAERIGPMFPKGSVYNSQPNLYSEDLRSLAAIMYTLPATQPTDNLLTLDKITLFLWRMLNVMIERASPDAKNAPLLGRPTPIAEPRQRRRDIIVNNIVVTIDVPDEDLRSAVLGQDVLGVDRDQLAQARSKLFNNIDQARTSAVINELLDPMLRAAWPSMFYTKSPLDAGLDEEAFAGGFYYKGRVVDLFEGTSQDAPGIRSIVGLAGFAQCDFRVVAVWLGAEQLGVPRPEFG